MIKASFISRARTRCMQLGMDPYSPKLKDLNGKQLRNHTVEEIRRHNPTLSIRQAEEIFDADPSASVVNFRGTVQPHASALVDRNQIARADRIERNAAVILSGMHLNGTTEDREGRAGVAVALAIKLFELCKPLYEGKPLA